MNRKSSGNFIGAGVATVVLIFVMLCMVTFAVLSLVTARADLKQSRKNAEYTTEYHEAENAANGVLFTVLSTLDEYRDAENAEDFYRSVRTELDGTEGISFLDDTHLSYEISAGSERLLHVTLELSREGFSDGRHYRILSWNIRSTHEWDSTSSLPLYEPE